MIYKKFRKQFRIGAQAPCLFRQFRIGAQALVVLKIDTYCVLHEQGIWICLRICFPDGKWNNSPLAEGMSP